MRLPPTNAFSSTQNSLFCNFITLIETHLKLRMIGQPMIDGKKNKAVSSLIMKSLAAEDNRRALAL